MSKAFRCDRCKRVFDGAGQSLVEPQICVPAEGADWTVREICQECARSFRDWWRSPEAGPRPA